MEPTSKLTKLKTQQFDYYFFFPPESNSSNQNVCERKNTYCAMAEEDFFINLHSVRLLLLLLHHFLLPCCSMRPASQWAHSVRDVTRTHRF